MYVEPNSTIRLLHGVNLDPTYQHTIYFNTAQDQANYFIGKTKHNLTKYYFQRKDRGVVKVNIDIGELYDCNYMMFRNDSFSNKWFYAFITNVEYANNGMSYVYFMIDIMQTWFFDYDIQESFVLRDHAMTDVAGDNIVPEEVTADIQFINSSQNAPIIVMDSFLLTSMEDTANGWSPCAEQDPTSRAARPYKRIEALNVGQIAAYMKNFTDAGYGEAIMGIVPTLSNVSMQLHRPTSIGTYTPRNKKLLTGQYCRYTFELGGNIMEIPLDVVSDPAVTSDPQTWSPQQYDPLRLAYKVYLTNYANASYPISMSIEIPINVQNWAYNSYANDANLQKTATAMMLSREKFGIIRDSANVGIGLATNAFKVGESAARFYDTASVSGIVSGLGGMANNLMDLYELSEGFDKHSEALARHRANMQAPATGGTINCDSLMDYGQLKLSGYVWTVLPQDAERIDKFFDMYGYAQNVMKIPNRNGRTHWNYVRTSGLEFHSRCPQEDMMNIVKIYENGITFWNNGDEIGNYSLDNTLH